MRIVWDELTDRSYFHGISRGVLYGQDDLAGVPWNGLTEVKYSTEGGDYKSYSMDGVKYHHNIGTQAYSASISALTYPDDFEKYVGGTDSGKGLVYKNQEHQEFHLTYTTDVFNSAETTRVGYQIHLVYNALVLPLNSEFRTRDDSPEVTPFTWDIRTRPVVIAGRAPTAEIVINSWETDAKTLSKLENILYGTTRNDPRMIRANELISLFDEWPYLEIVPRNLTGLARLIYDGRKDLKGDPWEGLYKAPEGTRLKPTSKPGLYVLRG